jgi:hypothetical protein
MRYFIGFLITIGLIILLVVLLFSGGGSKQEVPKTSKPLVDYVNTNAVVRLTADGPVNGDSIHEAIRITVGKDQVSYERIQGYVNHVVESKTFPNNTEAYDQFLYALQRAGFTQGDNSAALKTEKGHCPQGNRYIYEIIDGTTQIERYWASSCGKPASYQGAPATTNTLFKAQVPGYDDLQTNIGF